MSNHQSVLLCLWLRYNAGELVVWLAKRFLNNDIVFRVELPWLNFKDRFQRKSKKTRASDKSSTMCQNVPNISKPFFQVCSPCLLWSPLSYIILCHLTSSYIITCHQTPLEDNIRQCHHSALQMRSAHEIRIDIHRFVDICDVWPKTSIRHPAFSWSSRKRRKWC